MINKYHDKNVKLKEENNFEDFMKYNRKLIYSVKSKYRNCGMEEDELEQLAMITMWKCFTKWKVDKCTFGTFYLYCMDNEIKMYYRNKTNTKKVPSYMCCSTEELISSEAEELCIGDTIQDYDAEIEDYLTTKTIVDNFINGIENENYKQIILLQINGYKQKEIVEITNYSQSYICRIVKRYMNMLKKELSK